jgi:hypothetical protein
MTMMTSIIMLVVLVIVQVSYMPRQEVFYSSGEPVSCLSGLVVI